MLQGNHHLLAGLDLFAWQNVPSWHLWNMLFVNTLLGKFVADMCLGFSSWLFPFLGLQSITTCFWKRISNWCFQGFFSPPALFSHLTKLTEVILCIFSQTAKFDEPVTLDFLDAELENDIKVEVWHTDLFSNLISQTGTIWWCEDMIHIFGVMFLLLLFCTQIRNKMIDGKTGNYTISTLVKSQDEVMYLFCLRFYPFWLGIFLNWQ